MNTIVPISQKSAFETYEDLVKKISVHNKLGSCKSIIRNSITLAEQYVPLRFIDPKKAGVWVSNTGDIVIYCTLTSWAYVRNGEFCVLIRGTDYVSYDTVKVVEMPPEQFLKICAWPMYIIGKDPFRQFPDDIVPFEMANQISKELFAPRS